MSLLPEINQASAEINKFVAQANIHQTIAPVNTAEFTSPADTLLLASRDPVIREVSVGMTGDAYSDYSVSGTPPLSLPNSIGKPLKAWEVDVLPKQDLNGYDAPWPAGGGVNKFDIDNPLFTAANSSVLSNYASKVEDGKLYNGGAQGNSAGSGITIPASVGDYTLSFTINGENAAYEARAVTLNDDNTWASNEVLGRSQGNVTGNKTLTVTFPSGYTHLYFSAYSATKYGSYETNVQIETGSTAHAWQPYSNICPIHGTDKLTITTAGKNLLDDTGIQLTSTALRYARNSGHGTAVTLKKGYTYTVSVNTSTPANGVYIVEAYSGTQVTSKINSTYCTYTATEDKQVGFDIYWANGRPAEATHIMLEFGSTASPYVPYIAPSQTVITLPQTVYTGTIGSDGGESRTAVVDLGTLNWVAAGNANVFYSTGLNRANLNTASAIYRCEKYAYRGIAPGNDQAYVNGNNSFSVYSGADARVWIRDDAQWGDVTAFKASLQGVLLEYELVTPQTFPITAPTIPTPTGTATTWATAEDGTVDSMEVTYIKSE